MSVAFHRTWVILCGVALALSACGGGGLFDSSGDLSETPQVGYRPTDAGPLLPPPTLPKSGRHVVQRGDTVYRVSRLYGLPLRAVIEANRLRPPFVLTPGQVLVLPVMRLHTVQRGDTVYGIGRRYDVPVSELARLNNLQPPFVILPGDQLRLPTGAGYETVAEGQTLPEDRRRGVPVTDPPPMPSGRDVIVASPSIGVDGEALAPLPGASPAPVSSPTSTEAVVAEAPTAAPPPDPAVGQTAQVAAAPPSTVRAAVPPVLPATEPAAAPGTTAAEPAPNAVAPAAGPAAPQAASLAVVPKAPAMTGKRFQWPVNGEVIGTFGTKDGGRHNDGINIAAANGTPIRAAQNGVVAYVGNELRGYGNLVLVSHADGWITAYAHAESFAVKPGDVVKRGQVIGRVGATGGVKRPQLHFELRKGKRVVNPKSYLSVS